MKNFAPIFFILLMFSPACYAQDVLKAEIIAGDKNSAALVLTMEEGWYTYWRMAGDTGLPPKFDWSASKNLSDVKISWPVPSRFTTMDMHSFGYKNAVVLPLTVTPEKQQEKVELSVSADFVVCKDICIPQSVKVTQDLMSARRDNAVLRAAKKSLPASDNIDELVLDTAVVGKDALVVSARAPYGFEGSADLIVETSPPILTAPPEVITDGIDPTDMILKIKAPQGMDLSKELFGKKATLMLIHGGKAVEKEFSF